MLCLEATPSGWVETSFQAANFVLARHPQPKRRCHWLRANCATLSEGASAVDSVVALKAVGDASSPLYDLINVSPLRCGATRYARPLSTADELSGIWAFLFRFRALLVNS